VPVRIANRVTTTFLMAKELARFDACAQQYNHKDINATMARIKYGRVKPSPLTDC